MGTDGRAATVGGRLRSDCGSIILRKGVRRRWRRAHAVVSAPPPPDVRQEKTMFSLGCFFSSSLVMCSFFLLFSFVFLRVSWEPLRRLKTSTFILINVFKMSGKDISLNASQWPIFMEKPRFPRFMVKCAEKKYIFIFYKSEPKKCRIYPKGKFSWKEDYFLLLIFFKSPAQIVAAGNKNRSSAN